MPRLEELDCGACTCAHARARAKLSLLHEAPNLAVLGVLRVRAHRQARPRV